MNSYKTAEHRTDYQLNSNVALSSQSQKRLRLPKPAIEHKERRLEDIPNAFPK
jgi:hypothetical protein